LIFKITVDGKTEFAEIQFYFLFGDEEEQPYALVSMYGPPNADLLEDSSRELWACEYQGDSNLKVINISSIISVVSMQPLPKLSTDEFDGKKLWFVVEKSGLDDTELTGYIDSDSTDYVIDLYLDMRLRVWLVPMKYFYGFIDLACLVFSI